MTEANTSPTVYHTQSREQLLDSVTDLARQLKQTEHQLNWFKRQLFGEKSEKRFIDNPDQLHFGAGILGALLEEDNRPEQNISYTRKKGPKLRPQDCVTDSGLRFDASVPIKRIRLSPHEIEGLDESEFEIISIDKTYRLAQRPASSIVLCYERPVIKLKQCGSLCRALVPAGVIERSIVDVSFMAGMLVDKFEYHRVPRARGFKGLRIVRNFTIDEGLAPRSRFAGTGFKPLQAAEVKSLGGERCSKRCGIDHIR